MSIADAAGTLLGKQPGQPDQLTLAVDGQRYAGWLDVSIDRSIDRFTHTFSLQYTDRWVEFNQPWPIREGSECQVFFGNHLLVTGYVNTCSWIVSETEWQLHSQGRSLSGDLEDCTAIVDDGFWKFTPPIVIVNKLIAPFGMKAISTVSQALLPLERFELDEGETVHDAIERLCKGLALLPISRPDGNIELVRGAGTWQRSRDPKQLLPGASEVKTPFNRRNPIGAGTLAASISSGGGPSLVLPTHEAIERRLDVNDQDRYSDYTAIGQSRGTRFRASKIVTRMKEAVKDSAANRYRPLVVIAKHSLASTDNLKARATWEKNIRAGRSMRYSMLVPGVLAPNKKPYEPGTYCSVSDPAFGIDNTMILVSAHVRGSARSLVTELELTLPEAYSTLEYPAKPVNKKAKPGDNRPPPSDNRCVELNAAQQAALRAKGLL